MKRFWRRHSGGLGSFLSFLLVLSMNYSFYLALYGTGGRPFLFLFSFSRRMDYSHVRPYMFNMFSTVELDFHDCRISSIVNALERLLYS